MLEEFSWKKSRCLEECVGRNMNGKDKSAEGSDGSEERGRQDAQHFRKHVYHYERNIGRNMNLQGASGEVSGGNEGYLIVKWNKDDSCHEVPEALAELCSIAW